MAKIIINECCDSSCMKLKFVQKTLTANQIKTIKSIPIEMIPSPGSGKAIQVAMASAKYKAGIAFPEEPMLQLTTNGADAGGVFTTSNIVTNTTDQFIVDSPVGNGVIGKNQIVEDQPLMCTADKDSTNGTGTITYNIWYFLVSV